MNNFTKQSKKILDEYCLWTNDQREEFSKQLMAVQENFDFQVWMELVNQSIAGMITIDDVASLDLSPEPYDKWFQEGVTSQEAARFALEDNGYVVVDNDLNKPEITFDPLQVKVIDDTYDGSDIARVFIGTVQIFWLQLIDSFWWSRLDWREPIVLSDDKATAIKTALKKTGYIE